MGIPDESSAFETAPGNTTDAAKRNASQMPGPMISAANVGVTKMPGSIAESEMMTTPAKPMVLAKVLFTSSVADLKSPLETLDTIF